MKNYYEIADFNPLKSDFVPPAEFVPIRRYKPEEVLNQQAIDKFTSLGFELREVQMFTTPPYKITGIHIDGHSTAESKSAINYVLNGVGIMKWYRLKNTNITPLTTPAGTNYIQLLPGDCEETDSLNLSKLTLVEICQPHNIINNSKEFRYCFSIRYNTISDFESIKQRVQAWNNS